MVRGANKINQREITRVAKGLGAAGRPVLRTEFDPVTKRVVFFCSGENGKGYELTEDEWEKNVREEKRQTK
jgi:ribosomal protein L44E